MLISTLFPRRWTLFALLALLFLIASAPNVTADGELQVSVREATVNEAGAAQLLVKVVDRNGKPVRGLSAGSFTLKAGDKDVPITGVQSATDAQVGISALLVIDTSGSMIGAPLAAAREAAAQYVRSMQRADEVAVVSFANGSQVISDFSSDPAAVQAQLPRLTAFGDTALFDAVNDGAQRITARSSARRIVILLSDGADFGISRVSRAEALSAAAGSGVPFYVIGFGPTIDAPFLQQLAETTGGGYFAAPSSASLAAAFSEISEVLRSEYVVMANFAGSGLSGNTAANLRAEGPGGNGSVSLSLNVPALPTAPGPGTIPQPLPPILTDEGGSSAPVIFLVLVIIAAVVGWLVWRRYRKRARRPIVFSAEVPSFGLEDREELTPRKTPLATLRLPSGEEFTIKGLSTIGIDPDCSVRLPLSRTQFGNDELRIWLANERYVIRDLAARPRIRVNGRPVPFSILGDGDEIDINGLKLRFETQQPAASL